MMDHILRYINQTPERAPVDPPNVIRVASRNVPQQVRINLMTWGRVTEFRAWTDPS